MRFGCIVTCYMYIEGLIYQAVRLPILDVTVKRLRVQYRDMFLYYIKTKLLTEELNCTLENVYIQVSILG